MNLVAIVKIMDEDSGIVVREGDQIKLEQVEHSFGQELRLYEFHFHMIVTDMLERLCEEERERKRLKKRKAEREKMTLDEAIRHCEEVGRKSCDDCAMEHRQLADWLKELRLFRETAFREGMKE